MAGFGTAQFAGDRGEAGGIAAITQTGETRKRLEILRGQLESERSSFLSHWRDLADFILPRRARFTLTDANKGDRRNLKIIDATATLAARTLRSGMMAGVTSPARPWFRLSTPDPDLAEFGSVKEWLHQVSQRMSAIFLKSNLYNALPMIYGDMGVFATAAMHVQEDAVDTIRCYPFPIGSYMISNNNRLQIDTFVREFRMTVRQIVHQFGRPAPGQAAIDWARISLHVRDLWERNDTEAWVDVVHAVEPNPDYDPRRADLDARFKKFRSVYYEKGTSSTTKTGYLREDDASKMLSASGYNLFPVLAPRWEITGEDAYGTDCPGMAALGDIRQLQTGEKRSAQAIEKMVNPPMTGPTQLRNQKASILPGDITLVDARDGLGGFRPAHEVNPRIQELEGKQDQVRGRVRRAFFEDLFLMLATDPRRQPVTAREIDERHEEKLLALGPVLEQLNQDLLDPLIDMTFDMMIRQDLVPPAPQELQGVDLRVEYISIMAQAQKLVGLAGIERFTGFVGELGKVNPEVFDKVDADQLVDVYGDMTSVPPGIVRPDDQVAALRGQRAQAQQAQAAAEQAAIAGKAARDLSAAKLGENNALEAIINQAQAGQIAPIA